MNMLSGLLKGLLTGALGITGVGGTAFAVNAKPLSHFLTWKNKKISDGGVPVILCDDGYSKYEGFLATTSQGDKNDRGNGVTLGDFRVTPKSSNSYSKKWGKDVKNSSDGWGLWKIAFQGEDIETFFFVEGRAQDTTNRFTTDYGARNCSSSKIKLKDARLNQNNESGFEDKDIKFAVEESSCTKEFGSVTCNLIFDSSLNLKWSDDFKPTITFY